MGRQLLIENNIGFTISHDIKSLNENNIKDIPPCSLTIQNGRYYVNALLQRADVQNKNGRVYSMDLLVREVKRYMSQIKLGCSVGECDHPEDSVVSMKAPPHRVVDLWWEGNTLYGRLELLVSRAYKESGIVSTMGDKIAMLIEDYNMYVGISSRGVGSLKNVYGKNYVQDDFELICWDLVHSPSTHNSYLYNEKALTHESKENISPIITENSKINKYRKILL